MVENNNIPKVEKNSPDNANLENADKPKIEKNVLNNENIRKDEESVVETTTRDNEKEEKKGFFRSIFDKIKEIIKKVVTTVKNGFAKLTSKEVKALDSAKEEIEKQEEPVPEELKEEAKELEGVRAEVNVKDNEKVMKGIRETEEKFQQASEANQQRTNLEQPDKSDMEGPEQ